MDPQNQNQYDFILDPNQQKKSGPVFLQKPKQRIIIMVLFVATVLTLAIVIVSVFLSLGSQKNDDLIEVVAYQTEINRLSAEGLKEINDISLKSKVATLQSFISSDLQQSSAYLASSGTKPSSLQLSSKQSAQTTQSLLDAKVRNTYDDEFSKTITRLTTSYKESLQRALQNTTTANRQTILERAAVNILTFEE